MRTVKSKYKDPDKYIKRLNNKLKDAELRKAGIIDSYKETIEDYKKKAGDKIFTYQDTVEHEFNVSNSLEFSHFKAGDKLLLSGTVIESLSTLDLNCMNKASSVKVQKISIHKQEDL